MNQRESQPKVVSIAVAAAHRATVAAAVEVEWQPLSSVDDCALQGSPAVGDDALACAFERLRQRGQLDPAAPTTLRLNVPERHAVLAAQPASAAGSRPLQALFQALETYRSPAR